ncbi:MAG: ImmA/IrrE family metallo-endopeptidase [Acidobacteriota bacterium]
MRFLQDKISLLKIGWNERVLTEADFHRICRRLRVRVEEMPLGPGGFYYRVLGRDYIAIDSRLSGTAKLLVQFHELAHFLLHTPESGATANFHGVGRKTRQEREADLFALCALIPLSSLRSRSTAELADEGFTADIIRERLDILEKYGF